MRSISAGCNFFLANFTFQFVLCYMQILAIADIHGECRHIAPAAELIRAADIIALCGDISGHGSWRTAVDVISQIEKYNRNILSVHGNLDTVEVLAMLRDRGYSVHSDGKIIREIGFFGAGGSGRTPMKTPTEYTEEELFGFLTEGYEKINDSAIKVMISHAPPKGTTDRTFFGMRAGSSAVRKFIEKNHVNLCLSGHIHEARGVKSINSTVVANPGAFKKGRYLLIEIGDKIEVKSGKI